MSWRQIKQSISTKLYVTFFCIVFILSSLSGYVYYASTRTAIIYDQIFFCLNTASLLPTYVANNISQILQLQAASGEAFKRKIRHNIQQQLAIADRLILIIPPENAKSLKIAEGIKEIVLSEELITGEILEQIDANNRSIGLRDNIEYLNIVEQVLQDNVDRFVTQELTYANLKQDELDQQNRNLGILLTILILFSFISILFLISVIRKSIIAPTKQLETMVKAFETDGTMPEPPAPLENEIGSLTASFYKMTERVLKREEALRLLQNYLGSILNSMPSMLFSVDSRLHVTQWNRVAEDRTSISTDNAIGRKLKEVLPELADEIGQIIQNVTQQNIVHQQKRKTLTDSQPCHEEITIYPLVSDKFDGAVVRIDDVTSKVRMEETMVQSEKMLSVGGLAAGMAHEINNPLSGIMGAVQIIKNRTFGSLPQNTEAAKKCGVELQIVHNYLRDRKIDRMLDGIHEAGTRAADIITNMLNFTRNNANSFSSHNLAQLLDDTLTLAETDYNLNKGYDFKKIKTVREYVPDLPLVNCEKGEIQQVFLNILRNGAEAMAEKNFGEDSPCFIFRSYSQQENVVVEIEDNGPGMDETVRKRIMEPFYTTKPASRGTGLGLSVSFFIINHQHQGNLEVASVPGKWTRFIISLPIVKDQTEH